MAVSKQEARKRRHRRVRKHLEGTTGRPRLAVYRSNRYIYAQIIDDANGHTVAAASSQEEAFRTKTLSADTAGEIGKLVAERAKDAGVSTVVFDRGGYKFHGRIKALADAAREEGLEF